MRQYLRHDEASGELLLTMTGLWNGQHERTEYHVLGDSGPLRGFPEFDGVPVTRSGGQWVAVVREPFRREIPFRTDPAERAETQRAPCPRAVSRRRKCQLCQASQAGQ